MRHTLPTKGVGGLLKNGNFQRLISVFIFLGIWQGLGMMTTPLFLPTPMEVIAVVPYVVSVGKLFQNLSSTLYVLGWGFGVAILVGMPLGIMIGKYRLAANLSDLFISVLYAMPTVALIPLLMIWFGIGNTAKILIVLLSAIFPVVLNSDLGVRSVDPTLVDVAKVFGANERELTFRVILPSAVPVILTGIRIAIGRALVGVVVAELFLALSGVGAMLTLYGQYFQTAEYFVPLLVIALLSVALTELVRQIERKFSTWRTTLGGT